MATSTTEIQESPEYLRMSLAAAMTLGIKPGLFYRDARLYCINLLLTYGAGCVARCAYCGLSGKRPGEYSSKSFIRVTWPTHPLTDIVDRIDARQDKVKRVCISQITNRRSIPDTIAVTEALRARFDIPVSVLVSPTIVSKDDLKDFKSVGVDKLGVAIDLATPKLFDQYRGKGVGGPHSWDTYMTCLTEAIEVFGERNSGSHLVTGMGETEAEMVNAIQTVQDMGGWTHLFSFFPEAESALADHPMPDMDHYRRIQLARFLIDERATRVEQFGFDDQGRIVDFGVAQEKLDAAIDTGEPFRTSGCAGYDGQVACNRPFANSRPGPNMRNYPFAPTLSDVHRIRCQMGLPYDPALIDDEDDE